ncbi:MAG: cytochrome C, partial [Nitrospirae bacterium]|nr:cytochrome C [Nitrospirota bacterium]
MRLLKLVLVLTLISLPAMTFAAEKAKTIDELAEMYEVSSCKECHEQEYEEWSKSLHAFSLVGTPRTMATIKLAIVDGLMKEQKRSGVKSVGDIKKEHLMQCLKCHLPQIEDATDEVVREIAQAAIDGDAEKLKKVNINCLICHNKKALIHKFHDGEPENNVVYGNKDGEHPDEKYSSHKKSPIMREAVMCGQCHGLGANFDQPNPSQCATLYGSYLHSYIPSGGSQTCQDCHMHEFKKGHHMSSYRDPEVGERAINVVVEAPSYQFLPKPGDLNPTIV